MRNPIRLCSGVLLAFVAGYIDTATFLRVSELFSAHITGNFVVFAIALVAWRPGSRLAEADRFAGLFSRRAAGDFSL